jgi:hypothetical protein
MGTGNVDVISLGGCKSLAHFGPLADESNVDKYITIIMIIPLITYDFNGIGYEYIHKWCMQGEWKKGNLSCKINFLPLLLGDV